MSYVFSLQTDPSQGEFEKVLKLFAPNIRFTFAGEHALGAKLNRLDSVREWFSRMHHIFPTLKIVPERIVVAGLPWDMFTTTQFRVSATFPDGTGYENRGVQILRIMRGRIVEDHLIEDNLVLQRALQHLAGLGVSTAAKPPLLDA